MASVRAHPGGLAEFQRSRLLTAALDEASERGCRETSIGAVVARARVSRETFYEIFATREDCLAAVFEESLARIAAVVEPAYAGPRQWRERLRSALAALLAFLEDEPELGGFALAYITAPGTQHQRRRQCLLEALRGELERGRSEARVHPATSPLTAELLVGGVLAVIQARIEAGSGQLMPILNPLMSMIVLQYLGPAAANSELSRTPPEHTPRRVQPRRLDARALDTRLTYRTARVLKVIAHAPGASNVEIADRVEVADQGQISRLLARLARQQLIENTAPDLPGAANAWRLTRRGRRLESTIARDFAGTGQTRERVRGA